VALNTIIFIITFAIVDAVVVETVKHYRSSSYKNFYSFNTCREC